MSSYIRHSSALWMPEPIVGAIKSLYNTEATVITPDGETEFFEITASILQGDTLAPFIFIIRDFKQIATADANTAAGSKFPPKGDTAHVRRLQPAVA